MSQLFPSFSCFFSFFPSFSWLFPHFPGVFVGFPHFPSELATSQVQGLRAQRGQVAEQLEAAEGREAAARRSQERLGFSSMPEISPWFFRHG
jgi:hypothetical protein